MIHFIILRMTRTIHYCNFCDYKSDRRYDRDKHVNKKHGIDPFAIIQTGSGTEPIKQTTPQGKYSNIQHHSIHQLYETIKHWQKAYESLKDQNDKLYNFGKQWEEACKQREKIIRKWLKLYPQLAGHR